MVRTESRCVPSPLPVAACRYEEATEITLDEGRELIRSAVHYIERLGTDYIERLSLASIILTL
jgi:hypothetical protein